MGVEKTCSQCNEKKSIAYFYRQKNGLQGRKGECKECSKKRDKIWQSQNKDKKALAFKKYYEVNKDLRSELSRKWRENNPGYFKEYYKQNPEIRLECNKRFWERHPERYQAQLKYRCALESGKLVRGTQCQMCGDKTKAIHGHHYDYSKPLDVTWLCVDCHKEIHKRKKFT